MTTSSDRLALNVLGCVFLLGWPLMWWWYVSNSYIDCFDPGGCPEVRAMYAAALLVPIMLGATLLAVSQVLRWRSNRAASRGREEPRRGSG